MGDRRIDDPSVTALLDLIASHRVTAAISVAARLGIAELLRQGVNTPDQLARLTGTHEPSLQRLLDALVTIGICKNIGIHQFELTSIGEYLAGDTEQSLKPWALYEGEMLWRSWGGLLDSIRTGKNLAELTGFDSIFDLMERSPKVAQAFNAAMDAINRHAIPTLLRAYDFSGFMQLIDVGGGHGELMCVILKAYPSMRGIIYDLPGCAAAARQKLIEAGVRERGEFVAGTFLESVPCGADGLLLKSIIHNWDDQRSLTILRNCRTALTSRGKLVLIERLMPEIPEDNAEHRAAALSDLNMLRGLGGRERTKKQFAQLLQASGFNIANVHSAGRFNVIEATVV
jgi:hypothetical protein